MNTAVLRALTVNDIREGCRPSVQPALREESVYLNSTVLSYLCGHTHTHCHTHGSKYSTYHITTIDMTVDHIEVFGNALH